jgi:hypothetical protein
MNCQASIAVRPRFRIVSGDQAGSIDQIFIAATGDENVMMVVRTANGQQMKLIDGLIEK